jgi:prepilin-type N-terminal cleavage/methylation domain-containing protein
MTPRTVKSRAGVTLIELLVVMAIITALGLLALMLLPGISNSDGALKGTEEVRAQIKIAQALAGAARQPRGVRFLTGNTNTNPPLPNNAVVATELQLVESPPVTAFDPLTLQARASGVNGPNPNGVSGPYVELIYELVPQPTSGSTTTGGQVPGGIVRRRCNLVGLNADQRAQIEPGALLYMPTLGGGAWSRIATKLGAAHTDGTPALSPNEVELDVYPDAAMGASTYYRTYHAGIYGVPVPLLGVPTIPLPKDIGVDLEVSSPSIRDVQIPQLPVTAAVPTPPTVPYDLLFAPDGQTLLIGRQYRNPGVYLWVRDVTKVVNPGGTDLYSMLRINYAPAFPAGSATYYDAFRRGGEHHAVAVNNGAVGVAPINWPDASGVYPTGTDPFLLARRKTN